MRGREGFQTLRRIALLLLALAVLAERAGGRGHAVRSRVLWLLRPAELAARQLAGDVADELGPVIVDDDDPAAAPYPEAEWCPAADPLPGDSAHDAAELAQTFRALAFLFFALSSRCPARARVARPRPAGSGIRSNMHAARHRRPWRRARAPPGLGNAARGQPCRTTPSQESCCAPRDRFPAPSAVR